MDRKILKPLLAFLFIVGASPLYGFQAVIDATNAGHLINVLEEAKKQFQTLTEMSKKLENVNGRLGGILPGEAGERVSRFNTLAREWGQYIDSLNSPGAENFSALANLGYTHFGFRHTDRLTAIGEFLSNKLYPTTERPASYQQLEEIKETRFKTVKNSSIQGVALAGDKKHSLPHTQRKIAELGNEALIAPTIHDDLVVTNKLLTLIANELTQQREILSHQLELISAVVTQGSPLITKNNSRSP